MIESSSKILFKNKIILSILLLFMYLSFTDCTEEKINSNVMFWASRPYKPSDYAPSNEIKLGLQHILKETAPVATPNIDSGASITPEGSGPVMGKVNNKSQKLKTEKLGQNSRLYGNSKEKSSSSSNIIYWDELDDSLLQEISDGGKMLAEGGPFSYEFSGKHLYPVNEGSFSFEWSYSSSYSFSFSYSFDYYSFDFSSSDIQSYFMEEKSLPLPADSPTPKPTSAPQSIVTACRDLEGWEDSQGISCYWYSKWSMCTPTGGYGTGYVYDPAYAPFRSWANGGIDATQACCACGGGVVPELGCSDTNCLSCTAQNVCTSCVEGYYVSADGACTGCADSNCVSCTDGGICTSCVEGYYVDSLGRCSACSLSNAHCVYCSDEHTCSQCEWGYFVNDINRCSGCSLTNPNCVFCSDKNTCTTCQWGFYLDAFNRCSGVAVPCDQNCDKRYCDYMTGQCSKCVDNYSLNENGVCKLNEACGHHCEDCQTHCNAELCFNRCHSCEMGHYLSEDFKCLQDQCMWYKEDGQICKVDSSGAPQHTCSSCKSKMSGHCHHFKWNGLSECEDRHTSTSNVKKVEQGVTFIGSDWTQLLWSKLQSATSTETLLVFGMVPAIIIALFVKTLQMNSSYYGNEYEEIP